MPADQGLQPDDPAAAGVHLGLVVQHELVTFQRLSELVFQQHPLEGARVHHLGIELEIVSPQLLRMVHGGVRIFDQGVQVPAVVRVDADADAYRHEHLVPPELERSCHDVDDALRYLGGILGVTQVIEQDGEFVAPPARDHGGAVRPPPAAACPRRCVRGCRLCT